MTARSYFAVVSDADELAIGALWRLADEQPNRTHATWADFAHACPLFRERVPAERYAERLTTPDSRLRVVEVLVQMKARA